jgi:photosystem II stability/assembly factor-like uncharacterized protein
MVTLSLASGCRTSPWEELSPQYTKDTAPEVYKFRNLYPYLRSTWTSDGRRLWAVGDGGTILESNDGGSWNERDSRTTNILFSIFGSSDGERLWVVGDGGTILESDDGGEHWKARDSGTQNSLNSIFGASDGKRLWAVGDQGTILESDDGGEHWKARSSGTQNFLSSIFGSSDGRRLWAVGANGTILESDDRGELWNRRKVGTQNAFYSVFGSSDGEQMWAVGENDTMVEYDGAHWTVYGGHTTDNLLSIFGTGDGKRLWAVGESGKILESDDGEHWNQRNSGTQNDLASIFGTGEGGRLWAVGANGSILESVDGEHWNRGNSRTTNDLNSDDLNEMFGSSDGERLWVVGDGGTILESDDRGEHWNQRDSDTQNSLNSIFGASDGKRLWAVGYRGTILESDDRGEHWNQRNSDTQNSLNSIFGSSDGRRLWVVGANGTILESEDGGEHWKARDSGTHNGLFSIFGSSDGRRLWVVGANGTILESEDGGEHWKARDSGTQNSLSSIFGTSGGRGFWAVGRSGTILGSDDGEHWTQHNSGTTTISLFSIFGSSDGRRLWVVGANGTILESDDRGEHWNGRTSGTRSNLFWIFGTSDGKRLWAVGKRGTILGAVVRQPAPFLHEAHVANRLARPALELRIEGISTLLPTHISVQGRNDYDAQQNFPWRNIPCKVNREGVDQWACSFQPSALNLEVDRKAHFLIDVQHEGGVDTYEFTTIYDPWGVVRQNRGRVALGVVVLALIVFLFVLLRVRPLWNLRIYRFLKLSRIEKINIPGTGDVPQVLLRLVTVLPWFVRHPRTLDAWVEKHRDAIRQAWNAQAGAGMPQPFDSQPRGSQPIYVALPIRIGDPVSGSWVEKPRAEDIRKLVKQTRSTMQIIGPGGAGKTTLARQMGAWSFEHGSNMGLSDHPMLPVWVDEDLDTERNPLPTVVKGRLVAALADEEVEDELCAALLEKQRLLVFIDRLSERSADTQRYIETIYRSRRIGSLVLTSRTLFTIDGAPSVCLYPQPLNSATLLNFMTSLLSVFLADNRDDGQGGSRPLSSLQEQLKLGERLAGLIRLQTGKGEQDVPLVPLPVRLFVEQAVRLLHDGKELDDLPLSLPEVYFRHLRQINPEHASAQHFLDGDRMFKVAKLLGKVAVGKDYIPKEFSRNYALAELVAAGETVTASCDPTVRLRMNGVLLERSGGIDAQLRFALDPIAEFLAAAAHAEECGADADMWEAILLQSNHAPGFQAALKLTRQAYGRREGWAMPM